MPETQKLPTYATIGDVAGVSPMTVSNVLRSKSGVKPETRDLVYGALRKLNVPLSEFSNGSERRRRTRYILLVQCGVSRGKLATPVYSRLIHGIEDRCQELNWSYQSVFVDDPADLSEIADSFHGSGLIVFGKEASYTPFRQRDKKLPVVRLLHNYDCITEPNIDLVGYDRECVGLLAAQHLITQGCQRLAYFGNGKPMQERMDGFLNKCKKENVWAKAYCTEDLFLEREGRQEINHEALSAIWQEAQAEKPDGVFVMSDQVAVAIYGIALRAGSLPGEDFKVVACDYSEPFLSALHPRPASVDILPGEIGRTSVDQLVWRMENPEAPMRQILLKPQL